MRTIALLFALPAAMAHAQTNPAPAASPAVAGAVPNMEGLLKAAPALVKAVQVKGGAEVGTLPAGALE